ncbi:MAG: hypothetical protein ACE5JL_17995 [Dehalococcoidia bacterium]
MKKGWRAIRSFVTAVMEAPRKVFASEVNPAASEGKGKRQVDDGDLSNRVFAYLANHPDGARLVELEKEFGVSRFQMSRVIKNLINEGKVEKRKTLYFAI